MWTATFEPPELSGPVVAALCEALTVINSEWLYRHPEAPALYESGARYRREPRGVERWRPIPRILRLGYGDCEDLACYRAAELRVRAVEHANPMWRARRLPGGWLFHIVVQREDGTIEDPSRLLGM